MAALIVVPQTNPIGSVLDSVSSPITKPVYNLGLGELFAWFGHNPDPAPRSELRDQATGTHTLQRRGERYSRDGLRSEQRWAETSIAGKYNEFQHTAPEIQRVAPHHAQKYNDFPDTPAPVIQHRGRPHLTASQTGNPARVGPRNGKLQASA
jgi:hypothetical protein